MFKAFVGLGSGLAVKLFRRTYLLLRETSYGRKWPQTLNPKPEAFLSTATNRYNPKRLKPDSPLVEPLKGGTPNPEVLRLPL